MKVSKLFKIIVREFRKDFLLSVLLFVFLDFVYANFTGIELGRESGTILWQGGNETYQFGLSTVLLKLLNISAVFLTVGKIADKLSGGIMPCLLARITDYRKFLYAHLAVLLLSGEALLAVSHIVYYCFAGFYAEQAASALFYLFMDCLGFFGIVVIYIILNNCYALEHSLICIIALYLVNTVLPTPILAMSTAQFFIAKKRITEVPLILLTAGTDLAAAALYCHEVSRMSRGPMLRRAGEGRSRPAAKHRAGNRGNTLL